MQEQNIEKIIKNYNTPIYIFDIDKLKQRIQFLRDNLTKRLELCYAIKANTFIVKEINDDVERFNAADNFINSSLSERVSAASFNNKARKHNVKLDVLLRLTSGNQFGINEEDIERIVSNKETYMNLNFVGIQYFSGTQKRTNKRLQKEIDYLDEFLERLEEKYNYEVEELEFGTGFPVHYFQGEEFDEIGFLKEFSNGIDNMKYSGKIVIELGRSIAASCGYYLTKVVDKKTNKGQNYAILDGGIHHLVYYGQTMAMKFPHLEIYPSRENANSEDWNLMGSLCTINDIIIKQYPVSNLQIGDMFLFKNTGAYCMTEGISLFLSRELPQVVLLRNGELHLVRKSFKTYTLNKSDYNY